MLTYTKRRNLFGDLCNSSTAAVLTFADTLMNMTERKIVSAKDWDFLWRQYTKTTVAAQRAYRLPAYTRKPQNIYVTVGSYRYTPTEVTNRQDWDKLNATSVSSDIVTHCFYYDGQVELYPIPATSSNVITFNSRRIAKDLTRADYTTGTVTTVATSGVTTTVTGSGTTWTTAMIGRSIRIDASDLALTLSGDGVWYEVASVPSATTLTLTRTYGGTAVASASAFYTIGETSIIPEPHDMLPVYDALKVYFTSSNPDPARASLYGGLFSEGYGQMVRDHGSKANVVIDDGSGQYNNNINPNLSITL